jgi:hypothetical protein
MNNAFLVRLSVSVWTARKMDKAATKDARDRAGASAKAGVKLYKSVIAADALDKVHTIANAARTEHRKRTVPWAYDGPGAITAEGYPDYKAVMTAYEKDFHQAIAAFYAVYEKEREAARDYLQGLFNPLDYPTTTSLQEKFSFSVNAEPMPLADNFRVQGLAPALVEEIKKDIVQQNAGALQNANATAWGRVLEMVEKLKLRLTEYSNGQVNKFYDSWLENVVELANTIPSINVTGDHELTRIGQKLAALSAYSSADLKVDERLRNDCIKQAGLILASIGEAHRKAA